LLIHVKIALGQSASLVQTLLVITLILT
jgi:hypothetical protein